MVHFLSRYLSTQDHWLASTPPARAFHDPPPYEVRGAGEPPWEPEEEINPQESPATSCGTRPACRSRGMRQAATRPVISLPARQPAPCLPRPHHNVPHPSPGARTEAPRDPATAPPPHTRRSLLPTSRRFRAPGALSAGPCRVRRPLGGGLRWRRSGPVGRPTAAGF